MNYYTVYNNKRDDIEVFGDAKKCAKHLGIKIESFYYMISRQRRNENAKNRYSVVVEKQIRNK